MYLLFRDSSNDAMLFLISLFDVFSPLCTALLCTVLLVTVIHIRLQDNAGTAIEHVLLQKGSQRIEGRLLELAQSVVLGLTMLLVSEADPSSAPSSGSGTISTGDYSSSSSGWAGLSVEALMAEDPAVAAMRNKLRTQKEKLEQGLDSIAKFSPHCVAMAPTAKAQASL